MSLVIEWGRPILLDLLVIQGVVGAMRFLDGAPADVALAASLIIYGGISVVVKPLAWWLRRRDDRRSAEAWGVGGSGS